MNTTGRYYLTYDPRSEYATEYLEPDIRMSIDSEANLEQMCSFFDSFLKAAGYVYDGEVKIITPLKNVMNVSESSFGVGASSSNSPWGDK
jgi:hypothetical protein